jgi:hypothetical protein
VRKGLELKLQKFKNYSAFAENKFRFGLSYFKSFNEEIKTNDE